MDLAALLLFAGALLIAAGSPGPSIAALVARVLARGHRDVLPFLVAMWLGEAVWLTLAVWGLASIAQTFQLVFVAIKWAGIAYLLFLAWKMWHAPVDTNAGELPGKGSSIRMFGAGLSVTLGNPKIMVFYMAIVPSIIDLRSVTIVGWGELVVVMLLVLAAIDIGWVLLAARMRGLFKSPRALRAANRCSAGMMAGAASVMAAR